MRKRLFAVMLATVIAGCGGGGGDPFVNPNDIHRIVSFGDSLSDVGTYVVGGNPYPGPAQFDAGRYTTNPGAIWTEYVARAYGNKLLPAVQGGFGVPPIFTNGLGYAQGGAQVSSTVTQDYSGALAWPVSRQVDSYIQSYGFFGPDQLVLLQGGANDIINAVLEAANGQIFPSDVPGLVVDAAIDLADQVRRIDQAGGSKIALLNVPDIGATPFGRQNPEIGPALGAMSRLFNDTLRDRLQQRAQPRGLVLIDAYAWYSDTLVNYRRAGFRVGADDVACSLPKVLDRAYFLGLPNPVNFVQQNGWALLCSGRTLTEPDADQSYMFADLLHPASRVQQLFGRYVVSQLQARGYAPFTAVDAL